MSERADTAYSPKFCEGENSTTADRKAKATVKPDGKAVCVFKVVISDKQRE